MSWYTQEPNTDHLSMEGQFAYERFRRRVRDADRQDLVAMLIELFSLLPPNAHAWELDTLFRSAEDDTLRQICLYHFLALLSLSLSSRAM